MNVEDIVTGTRDATGAPIEEVYAKFVPLYAVFRTAARVRIQFSDDPATDAAQRKALIALGPVRGEINGLMDSWRSTRSGRLLSAVSQYEQRVADAVIVGLDGDAAGALSLLTQVKADLLDERQSTGRQQYLLVGLAAAVVVLIVDGAVAALTGAGSLLCGAAGAKTWSYGQLLALAAAGGAVGALMSIALGIRGRTVLTDMRFADNAMDAALRVLVGLIAAPALVGLALTGAVTLDIGTAKLGPHMGQAADGWLTALLVAFVAGFLERLVPDLLAKAAPGSGAQAPGAAVAPIKAGGGPGEAPAMAGGVGAAAAQSPPDPDRADPDAVDGCASGVASDPANATPDAALPAASGG